MLRSLYLVNRPSSPFMVFLVTMKIVGNVKNKTSR